MSFFKRLLAVKRNEGVAPSHPHSQLASGASQMATYSQFGTRRELLRVALRDTLGKHGIPSAWIGAEALGSTSSKGAHGVHWRLLVRHWEPRLLTHGVALQQALIQRVTSFDPLASEWLTGISWQFALADESPCPALPEPSAWTSAEPRPATDAATARALAEAPAAAPPLAQGDVIAGPVHIAEPPDADATRADLEALMAIRDADFQANGAPEGTQPMWLRTEPAPLQ